MHAGSKAAAWTCGDSVAITQAQTTAAALANATAQACSLAYASCEVDGGYACAFAGTEIKQAARAVARAFAELWAGAYTCPSDVSCGVSVDAVTEAVGTILVKAASEAFAAVCTGAPIRFNSILAHSLSKISGHSHTEDRNTLVWNILLASCTMGIYCGEQVSAY